MPRQEVEKILRKNFHLKRHPAYNTSYTSPDNVLKNSDNVPSDTSYICQPLISEQGSNDA